MKKLIAAVFAVIMICAVFAACSGKKETASPLAPYAGTYESDYCKWVGASEPDDEPFGLQLNSDGTGTFSRDNNEFKISKWNVDGENFTMTETFLGAENEYTGTLKDGVLTIYNGDPTNDLTYMYVFNKK